MLVGLLSASGAVAAQAPDPDGAPVFASVHWSALDGAPHAVQLQTGGAIDAHFDTDLPGACDGDVTRRPSVRLEDVGGDRGIQLRVRSLSRTRPTLVVHGPDGRWHCDHGNPGRRLPEMQIDRPVPGSYAIWVGAYESQWGDAELVIEQTPRE